MSKKEKKKEHDDRFLLFLIPSWGISGLFFIIFFKNSGWVPNTPVTLFDLTYLIVALITLVLPFVSRIKLGKLLELERNLKETREDIAYFKNDMRQAVAILSSVSAIASNVTKVDISLVQESESEVKPQIEGESKERTKTAMELKILNTLWKRQVFKYPELNGYWTFRLNAVAPEFLKFREAGNRLIGEGLISETDIGQFIITGKGLIYCAEHYNEFPVDMWVKDVTIPKGNLQKLLKHVRRLDKSAIGG